MFLDVLFDINKLWYAISDGLLNIIDGLMAVFYWFAGVMPTSSMNPTDGVVENSLLSAIFNNRSNEIGRIYLIFVAIGVACLGVAVVVGLVKASFSQDQVGAKKKVVTKSLYSLFWILIIPLIFMAVITCVTTILNLIVTACGLSSNNESLGTIIGRASMTGKGSSSFKVGWAYEQVQGNFNYLLCILSSACVVVGLFLSTFIMVERLIHIVFLYVVSPFVLAKTPLDDGKSMTQWTEMCFTKFLSVAGIIICMYLFFLVMPVVTDQFNIEVTDQNHRLALNIAKIAFIIAGAFTFTKAGTLFAHLISSSAGQFEGMSLGQSTGMLSMGARLGLGAMNRAYMGTRMGVAGGFFGGGGGVPVSSSTGYSAQPLGAGVMPMASPMSTAMARRGGGMGIGQAFAYGGILGAGGAMLSKLGKGIFSGAKKVIGGIRNQKNGFTLKDGFTIAKIKLSQAKPFKNISTWGKNHKANLFAKRQAHMPIFNPDDLSAKNRSAYEAMQKQFAPPVSETSTSEQTPSATETSTPVQSAPLPFSTPITPVEPVSTPSTPVGESTEYKPKNPNSPFSEKYQPKD